MGFVVEINGVVGYDSGWCFWVEDVGIYWKTVIFFMDFDFIFVYSKQKCFEIFKGSCYVGSWIQSLEGEIKGNVVNLL